MPLRTLRWLNLLLLTALGFAADIKPDTARLASHLSRIRAERLVRLPATEYKAIQQEYLSWIDSRVTAGRDVTQLNEELRAAGLFAQGPRTTVNILEQNDVGTLAETEPLNLQGAEDLLALKVGIPTGTFCGFDETAVLYTRSPIRRLMQVNAEQSLEYGYHLRALEAGPNVTGQGRLIGSMWVISNCTSNSNGETIRIDRSRPSNLRNVLDKEVGAFAGDDARISVDGDIVTFDFSTRTHESSVLVRKAIARYRVQNGRAIRKAPIAPQFAGFLDEWLDLDDIEAARWSTPAAARAHHDLSATYRKDIFEWERVADCPGSPPAREITVRWSESKRTTAFLISGSFPNDMRMVSITDDPSPYCQEIDIRRDKTSIMNQP